MITTPNLDSLAYAAASDAYIQAVRNALFDTLNATTVEDVILCLKTASCLALWRHDCEMGEKDLTYIIRENPQGSFKATLRYNASLRSILAITLEEDGKVVTVETTFTRDTISKLTEFYFGETP